MKNIVQFIVLYLVGISATFAIEPLWLTAACYEMKFSAWDKFGAKNYKVTYIVKSDQGNEFVAELNASGHNSSEVVFPEDFKIKGSDQKASISCHGLTQYSWEIYVNDELKDSGEIVFSRSRGA